MGSIRPLITIAILVGAGAYLYVKINEGPVPSRAAANSASQSPDGVPPLTGVKSTTLAADNSAPAWPSTTPPAAATAPPTSAKSLAKESTPTVPTIPDLPPLPAINDSTPATLTTPPPLPNNPSANNPVAANPDPSGKSLSNAAAKDVGLPPAPLSTADPKQPIAPSPAPGASVTIPPVTPPALPSLNPPGSTPPASSSLGAASIPTSPPSQSSATNPLRSVTPAGPASDDRYANPPPTGLVTAIGIIPPTTPGGVTAASSFSASWPAIQAALDRHDLKQAHQLLSKWHADPSLSPADSAKVETLLSQLAGTVIYSTEHQLEPARVVKPGETLDAIAKEYNVTPQLLAKINGVPASGPLPPGKQLKVVRGPFAAIIDVRRSELTLTVDDRYAGKFHVNVPAGANFTDGQWLVEQKLGGSAATASPSAYAATAAAVDRSIVLRNAAAAAGAPTLLIASGSGIGLASNPPALRVSPQDAEEISDILSVGSRVVVRK